MNILIPMAGRGSRFAEQGYSFPKPLIDVGNNTPMIKMVVDNLNLKGQYIFIVLKEHYDRYNLETMLNLIAPGCKVVQVNTVTQGAACTALLAKEYVNSNTPLVIANSDQYLDWDSSEFMYANTDHIDGAIAIFKSIHPRWSFVKVENGLVIELAEKNPISDNATCGVYYFKRGSDFVEAAEKMIQKDIRTNGEYYLAPTFNEMIQDGKKIKVFQVKAMYGTGTPEDLQNYLKYKNA